MKAYYLTEDAKDLVRLSYSSAGRHVRWPGPVAWIHYVRTVLAFLYSQQCEDPDDAFFEERLVNLLEAVYPSLKHAGRAWQVLDRLVLEGLLEEVEI